MRASTAAVRISALAAALALAACGTSTPDAAPGTGTAGTTLTHKLGTITVPDDPQRVVALGEIDQDAALALGFAPVGIISTSLGEDGVAPWTRPALGDPPPAVLTTVGDAATVDVEQVAALDPDLILAAGYYDIDTAYPALSAIAPTTAYQSGPAEDTWQQVTRQVGQALGQDAAAGRLVSDVEQQMRDTAAAHPQLDGASFTLAVPGPSSVTVLRAPDDVTTRFLAELGLTLSPAVLALPQGPSFSADVSYEQIGTLDADTLLAYFGDDTTRAQFEAAPLVADLPVVKRGAYLPLDLEQFYPLRAPTPLSIPYTLTTLVPRVADAVATARG